jgi:ADP-ribosylglycohydrolase
MAADRNNRTMSVLSMATRSSATRAVRARDALRLKPEPPVKRRWRGCLLGGAVGDALGAPVEFMALEEIRRQFGEAGITEFTTAFGRKGAITDDTQMALFTAEGLLRATVRGAAPLPFVALAYQRWLHTQGGKTLVDDVPLDGWLIGRKELFASRVPGDSCLDALAAMRTPGDRARNRSKGCGGAMRVAPVGLFCASEVGTSIDRAARRALDLGCDTAALTHGHPTGQLAAGALAALIALVVREVPLADAVKRVKPMVARRPLSGETLAALERAEAAAAAGGDPGAAIATLGEGWVADEALAIALYVALAAPDFETGVRLAVNHDGDSDSTGAMAGNLLGALHGLEAIPRRWLTGLELGDAIEQVADDLATYPQWPIGEFTEASPAREYWMSRYPGH